MRRAFSSIAVGAAPPVVAMWVRLRAEVREELGRRGDSEVVGVGKDDLHEGFFQIGRAHV